MTSGTGPLHHTCRARHPLAKQSLSCANTEAGPPQHSRPPEKRGWGGYFRYGNSARLFDAISQYALERLAGFVAKRHKRSPRWGMRLVTCGSPDNFGLITLCGTDIAPRPFRPWRAPAERRR